MTVSELIKILADCDKDAEIYFTDLDEREYEFCHMEYNYNDKYVCVECGRNDLNKVSIIINR